MGDRVFIADYIKKKRRRKGNIEYLVKWKGYPTRHCTWEPQENILDASLIKQFDEEGYDPRRVRAACRKKKRRRSEITEARSMILPFSDSDSEHDRSSHDLLSSHQNKVSPVSLSKYGGVWHTDATNKKQLDTQFDKESESRSEQKNTGGDNDIINDKENEILVNEHSVKNSGTLHKNGGKSCHPKMRAKFMFRSGDYENMDWGSCNDWSSSDNESMRGLSNKEIYGLNIHDDENPSKRRRLSTFSVSSAASESTIPAIEELECSTANAGRGFNIDIPMKHDPSLGIDSPSCPEYDYNRPNSCPYLESSFIPRPCSPVLEETTPMPVLTNETLIESDDPDSSQDAPTMYQEAQPMMATDDETSTIPKTTTTTLEVPSLQTVTPTTESTLSSNPVNGDAKSRDNVFVTEVTLENLTVIIQECGRTKGFFKWEQ